MRDFTNFWNQKAQTKLITVDDVFKHCIVRAMRAKSDEKLKIAKSFIQQAFTPISNENKLSSDLYHGPYKAVEMAATKSHMIAPVQDLPYACLAEENRVLVWNDIFETEEELMTYNRLKDDLRSFFGREYKEEGYVYIIVRKDMTPEQQAVQAAHVAGVLGWQVSSFFKHKENPFYTVNFVLVSTENLETLMGDMEYVNSLGLNYVAFDEPDMNGEITAVATEAVQASQRRVMKRYKLMKFNNESANS